MSRLETYLSRGVVIVSVLVSCAVIAMAKAAASDSQHEAAFLQENSSAMDKMMAGMTVKPSGDVDRDFAVMMIAHHKGAVDMARSELLYGDNEQLRRIAQGIIVEQQQEIVAMQMALEPRSQHH